MKKSHRNRWIPLAMILAVQGLAGCGGDSTSVTEPEKPAPIWARKSRL